MIRKLWQKLQKAEKALDRKFAGDEIAKCPRCGELLKIRYTLKFMSHLRYDHNMSEDEAIETGVRVSEIIYKARIADLREQRVEPKAGLEKACVSGTS